MRPVIALIVILFALAASCKHDSFVTDPPQTGNPIDTTSDDTTNLNPCDPDSAYFLNDVLPILLGNCAFGGCHGDGSAQDGIELSSYGNILSTGSIDPGDLSGSDLFEAITETDPDKVMPPPPNSPLTPDQISTIALWISQGAPNNSCDGCDTTMVTFSGIVSPIIQSSCQGCHSGPTPGGGITLLDHGDVAAIALDGRLVGTIKGAPGFVPMPFGQDPLDDCKQRQIELWVLDGAPNN